MRVPNSPYRTQAGPASGAFYCSRVHCVTGRPHLSVIQNLK